MAVEGEGGVLESLDGSLETERGGFAEHRVRAERGGEREEGSGAGSEWMEMIIDSALFMDRHRDC